MKIIFMFFFCGMSYGQQLHHQMLSAQGNTAITSKGVKVTQTIAQQSVVGTNRTNKLIVSQGFQQSKISNAAIVTNNTITTIVFPNPVIDNVNFKFSSPVMGKIKITLFDIHGRLLLYQEKEAIDNILTITNFQLAEGEYIIRLDGSRYSFTTTIIKSN